MSYASLAAGRRLCGVFGCALLVLVLSSLVDGMITGGFKDPFRLDLLPGQSVKLSEPLPRGAERLEDIELRASNPGISARFEETFSGFWLGGTLWRGEARLAPDLPVGDYSVAVFYHNGTAPSPPQAYSLRVHPDLRSIRMASGSFITRTLGLSPYIFAVYLLGLALVPMAASFVLSRKIAQALRGMRMAEIYRAMAAPPDTLEGAVEGAPRAQRIFFSPGPGHGLTPGSLVEVLDERGQKLLATAEVIEIIREDVTALVLGGAQVRPGSLARLPQTR